MRLRNNSWPSAVVVFGGLRFSDARVEGIHQFPLRPPEWRVTFLGSAVTHVGGVKYSYS